MARGGLQKLIHPGMSGQIFERGYEQVGGYVINVTSANELPTPAALLAAHGIGGDWGTFVDVVRFHVPTCATLANPDPAAERPWPTYRNGFLTPVDDSIVPVWMLSTTRYPPGAEMWRIHDDGRQEMVLWYAGAARGWVGARGWRPTSRYFGTRATWQAAEYAADVIYAADGAPVDVELTAFAEPAGDGWGQRRAQTWSRTVPIAECEVFEIFFTATIDGVAVRVLALGGPTVHVQLVGDDPEAAERIGASMIDPGVFENPHVPGEKLQQTQFVANQLVPAAD